MYVTVQKKKKIIAVVADTSQNHRCNRHNNHPARVSTVDDNFHTHRRTDMYLPASLPASCVHSGDM
jgi:hypothetical protein